MTNAAVSTLEHAAIPTGIAVIDALQQFLADMGTDPAKWVGNFPGAQLKLMGTIQLQFPTLLGAEGTATMSLVNQQLSGWKAKLQAQLTATNPTTPPAA